MTETTRKVSDIIYADSEAYLKVLARKSILIPEIARFFEREFQAKYISDNNVLSILTGSDAQQLWSHSQGNYTFYVKKLRGVVPAALVADEVTATPLPLYNNTSIQSLSAMFNFNVRMMGSSEDWFDAPVSFSMFQSPSGEVREIEFKVPWMIRPGHQVQVTFGTHPDAARMLAMYDTGTPSQYIFKYWPTLWLIGDRVNETISI